MYRKIDNHAIYEMDGKVILLVSNNYKGYPLFYLDYDVLMCSEEILKRYYNELGADRVEIIQEI